jgi:hypothetical protein
MKIVETGKRNRSIEMIYIKTDKNYMYQSSLDPKTPGTSGIGAAPLQTNLLLHINGGLGKCIMATAVIRSYKAANPQSKVVVVSGYPEVFLHNPDIYKNFPFNTPYLWQDYYGKPGWNVEAQDPYLNDAWIKNRKQHLIDIWCGMLRIPSIQKTPLLYFSGPEADELNSQIKVDKPLLVVQSTGGSNPGARSWTRNPPQHEFEEYLAQFKDTHFVLHLALPDTPVLRNVHQRVDNFDRRKAMCLMYYAQEVLGIDSYAMHARAANPNAGPSVFFLPLAETEQRLGYQKKTIKYLTPRQEIQDLLKDHQDYFATVFKLGIEDISENCPVVAGERWFDFKTAPMHVQV